MVKEFECLHNKYKIRLDSVVVKSNHSEDNIYLSFADIKDLFAIVNGGQPLTLTLITTDCPTKTYCPTCQQEIKE